MQNIHMQGLEEVEIIIDDEENCVMIISGTQCLLKLTEIKGLRVWHVPHGIAKDVTDRYTRVTP